MAKKQDKITFRCRTSDKEAFELAAKISGCSLSDFVLKATSEMAAKQIADGIQQ